MSEVNNEPPAKGEGDVEKIAKAVEGLLAKHGDPNAALRVLLNENHGYRDKLRDVSAKLPPDGAVILTGDEAKHWSAYREFGAPSEIRKAITERDQFRTEADGFRLEKLQAEAAKAIGCTPGDEFNILVQGLPIEVVDGKDDGGKPARVAQVRGADGENPVPLAEYLKSRRPTLFEALRSGQARPTGTPRPNGFNQPPPRPGAGEHDEYAAQRAQRGYAL